jgi:hypothetical protein
MVYPELSEPGTCSLTDNKKHIFRFFTSFLRDFASLETKVIESVNFSTFLTEFLEKRGGRELAAETPGDYYVYILVDPAKVRVEFNSSIFYVGKGKGYRNYVHNDEAEKSDVVETEKICKIRELSKEGGYYSVRVFCNLTNTAALLIEGLLIRSLGSFGLTLTNQTVGKGSGMINEEIYFNRLVELCQQHFGLADPGPSQLLFAICENEK